MLFLFGILIFIYHFTAMFYQLSGVEPSPAMEFLYFAAFPCGIAWWLRSDKRESVAKRLYCQGVMASSGAIFIIPYHLVKTRGWKGLLPLLALVACYLGSQVLAVVLYFVFAGSSGTY